MRSKRFIGVLVGVICALGVGSAVALAADNDSWSAGTNAAWSASLTSGTSAVLTAGFGTVTCTAATAGGSNISTGPDVGNVPANPPTFSGCTWSSFAGSGNATVTPVASGWTADFYSDTPSVSPPCPSGTSPETENASGDDGPDCLVVNVPANGFTVSLSSGCIITIPTSAFSAGGTVTDSDDNGGVAATAQFNVTGLPWRGNNALLCGGSSGTNGSWTANYTLTAPNGGVLYDKS